MSDVATLANAEQLTAKTKRRYKFETLPISGLKVRIQSLMAGEISRYQGATYNNKGDGLKMARLEDAERRLIVLCLVDTAGNRILSNSHTGDLAGWDGADASYLYTACAEHTGIKTEDIERLVVEGMAKNSSETAGEE